MFILFFQRYSIFRGGGGGGEVGRWGGGEWGGGRWGGGEGGEVGEVGEGRTEVFFHYPSKFI
ncbi:hypothetical protein FJR39_13760 [Dolichospermum flos-aquae UHCC 0037]|uniref:Uncharacterized protein n=1 Tax=Dolichospermum flos-aquae UHCC 0037 TaxID=2590026 RepID=A0ACC7S7K9_DOLFA|nr:hypothetical protein [Dolichospermum flos-aquae UHCC 0037]